MSSAIYPDPPRLVTAVCGHGEQQRLSNARLRLTFLLFPGYSLARARREIPDQSSQAHALQQDGSLFDHFVDAGEQYWVGY